MGPTPKIPKWTTPPEQHLYCLMRNPNICRRFALVISLRLFPQPISPTAKILYSTRQPFPPPPPPPQIGSAVINTFINETGLKLTPPFGVLHISCTLKIESHLLFVGSSCIIKPRFCWGWREELFNVATILLVSKVVDVSMYT